MYSSSRIAVLVSTYNGEKYVEQQLRSILDQDVLSITVYIRDDGSTDKTIDIIMQLSTVYQNLNISYLNGTNLGSFKSFMFLLEHVEADYYFFADQDDVWDKSKIRVSLEKMFSIQEAFPNTPILIHTDLSVVDANLNLVNPSFWKSSGINQQLINCQKKYAFVTNFVVGCTMLFNKQVKQLGFPINRFAKMHDEWLSLCTLFSGGFVYGIENSTILYRQHGNNVIGAKPVNTYRYFISKLTGLGNVVKDNLRRYRLCNDICGVSIIEFLFLKLTYIIKR